MLQMLRRRMYREEKGFTLIELLEADGAAHRFDFRILMIAGRRR